MVVLKVHRMYELRVLHMKQSLSSVPKKLLCSSHVWQDRHGGQLAAVELASSYRLYLPDWDMPSCRRADSDALSRVTPRFIFTPTVFILDTARTINMENQATDASVRRRGSSEEDGDRPAKRRSGPACLRVR